ncbi:hypothetical proteins containing pentapeptide repeats [Pseudomonas phage KPP25]|uniref:Pentapeptide repeat-containing protein n=1 Tax=Pseudomonas phage KPP25 TaxID=1462608 RepID=X5HZR0_BPKP2|nr:hypothetical proteins containing pentapeptide repeats [Pseudomonas phage KPP25]BAO58505.1 hypothetical proteins containing pentapeptide repeats [Pseudomonas phage KPP25]
MPSYADYPMPTKHKRLITKVEVSKAFEADLDNHLPVVSELAKVRTYADYGLRGTSSYDSYVNGFDFDKSNAPDAIPYIGSKAQLAKARTQHHGLFDKHVFNLALARHNPNPGTLMKPSRSRLDRSMCYSQFTDCFFDDCLFQNIDIVDATFTNCVFFGCTFNNCASYRTKFVNCIFLSTFFQEGKWANAKFTGCKMYRVRFCLSTHSVSTSMPQLEYVQFYMSKLVDVTFEGDIFYDTIFPMSHLIGVALIDVDLANVDMRTALHVDIESMRGCRLSRPNPTQFMSMNIHDYPIVYTSNVIQIGCQAFSMDQLRHCISMETQELYQLASDAPRLVKAHLKWLLKTIERFKPKPLPYEC